MTPERVSVVVPNWNGRHLLEDCLESLLGQTLRARVIVVDNGSTDGSAALVRSAYPAARLVELDSNQGFAGGVNRGIEAAMGDGSSLVALFNNDARADAGWLEHLVGTMDSRPEAGIVTSKVLQADGRHIDSAGNHYSTWGHPFPRGRDELDLGQYDQAELVFGASGASSLYRVEMLRRIGLFDEDFFAYYEDDDVSFRAQLAGWKVLYEPASVARHHIAATSSKHPTLRRRHVAKNAVYLYHKNMPGPLYLKYLPLFGVGFLSLAASLILKRDPAALWCALSEMARNAGRLRAKRRAVQATRTVSHTYIDSMLYHDVVPGHRFPLVGRHGPAR